MILVATLGMIPIFAPEGRRYIAMGREPLDGKRNVETPSPGRGDSPAENALSPLPGLGRRGMIAFQGLTPLAIHCRPSGAKRGVSE